MTDAARAAGRLVAVPLAALARLRRGKPMHPRGAVFDGVLERRGSSPPWGIPWLDEAGADPVLVRHSRSLGLPSPLPDFLGLAVRVPGEARPVDLLLTTTGRGPLGRFLLLPRRDGAVPYTSIMGYRSDAGTLRIAALPEDPTAPSDPGSPAGVTGLAGTAFTLAAARGGGPWRPFARLALTRTRAPVDPDVRFDAVGSAPPGLVADGPMARFRAPAYARSQEARGVSRRG